MPKTPGSFAGGPDARRRGSWKKGQSGNPKGSLPGARGNIAKAFRASADLAIKRVIEIAKEGKPADSLVAIRIMLERGWGQPTQRVELTGAEGGPVQIADDRPLPGVYLAEWLAGVPPVIEGAAEAAPPDPPAAIEGPAADE